MMPKTPRPAVRGKYCPDVVTAIAARLSRGVPFKYACESSDISEQTGYDWLKDPKKPEFSLAVTRARAEAVEFLTTLAVSGGKSQSGSSGAMWLLERQFRKEFGDKKSIELTGKDGGPIETLGGKLDQLSVDDLKKLADANGSP